MYMMAALGPVGLALDMQRMNREREERERRDREDRERRERMDKERRNAPV